MPPRAHLSLIAPNYIREENAAIHRYFAEREGNGKLAEAAAPRALGTAPSRCRAT